MTRLVYGVGLNDSFYVVVKKSNGSRVHCRFYLTWKNMLKRCYSEKYQSEKQSYLGCLVCESWLTFSNFKAWMEKQDWRGKQLDKDILYKGNKIYSPKTCVFLDQATNKFTIDRMALRGECMLGVSFRSDIERFQSRCCNPISGKQEHLGYFNVENEAHLAWKKRKHELACQLADLQTDDRIAKSLRERYL